MTTDPEVHLDWLWPPGQDGRPDHGPAGVSWGVPWPAGQLHDGQELSVVDSGGREVPAQSRSIARWPDGSVKWTAHDAAVATPDPHGYRVVPRAPAEPAVTLRVHEHEDGSVEVDTGSIRLTLGTGTAFVRRISRGPEVVCSAGELVSIHQSRTEGQGARTLTERDHTGHVDTLVVEQSGPVRAVVRVQGRHAPDQGGDPWLPFVVRLYLYAGQDAVRLVHTLIYDGDPERDFVKGVGLRFTVPARAELYNRQIRFTSDTGQFSDSPKGLRTARTEGRYRELLRDQFAGRRVELDSGSDAAFLELLQDSATWNDFAIVQDSPDHYTIRKRTSPQSSWVTATEGRHGSGVAFFGDAAGGLAVGLRDAWRKAPTALEVRGAAQEQAQMTVWLWSPHGEAMDLRHYDREAHAASAYEGFDELRATPYGVANTGELTLWPRSGCPTPQELQSLAGRLERPALLIADPAWIRDSGALGSYSLRDACTPARAWLERQLTDTVDFYRAQIHERGWFGFWNYGDVMHTYDDVRHCWRYDVGGYAWQNTELVPNLWLWYSFLRSEADSEQRAPVFRMAEAMTRHTSETDVYHMGPYAGLGSRHNISHWGCACKEARISMAGLHRIYYYLTTDERVGDLMDQVRDADHATADLDPMRFHVSGSGSRTHARTGPDWAAFCSNWMTAWERHGDTGALVKIRTGIDSLQRSPLRLLGGPVYGYDPGTGELSHIGDDNYDGRHLAICMGGPQVWFELAQLLDDPQWTAMLVELGEFYHLSPQEKRERTGGALSGENWQWPVFATAVAAFAAAHKGDRELARRAWSVLLDDPCAQEHFGQQVRAVDPLLVPGPVREVPWVSTNVVSQWCLNTIFCLDLIGGELEAVWPGRT